MKFWVGNTDIGWFKFLRERRLDDVNFWQPGGNSSFRVIERGAPFLFRLKAPINAIGGVGFFSTHAFLPIGVAWDAFSLGNGCASLNELKKVIDGYRKNRGESSYNPVIGCIILTNPIFFNDDDFIPDAENWHRSIVQGKSFHDDERIGRSLWKAVEERLEKDRFFESYHGEENQLQLVDSLSDSPRYRESILSHVRLGQGAFRIMVTEACHGRCAVTGDHTLPVLEAAHIKPFSESGPDLVSNGILLRADIHKLFDAGYVTITPDYRLEVSQRLKTEFENGRIYYDMHGRRLQVIPETQHDIPRKEFLSWHCDNVYKAG